MSLVRTPKLLNESADIENAVSSYWRFHISFQFFLASWNLFNFGSSRRLFYMLHFHSSVCQIGILSSFLHAIEGRKHFKSYFNMFRFYGIQILLKFIFTAFVKQVEFRKHVPEIQGHKNAFARRFQNKEFLVSRYSTFLEF